MSITLLPVKILHNEQSLFSSDITKLHNGKLGKIISSSISLPHLTSNVVVELYDGNRILVNIKNLDVANVFDVPSEHRAELHLRQLWLNNTLYPNLSSHLCKLSQFLKEYSLRKDGPYKLASGGTSDFLIDLSTSLRTKEGQNLLTLCIRSAFTNTVGCVEQFDAVGGPISGSDLVSFSCIKANLADKFFGVRKNPKGRGLDTDCITGNLNKNDRVLVVEDVCTTGSNLLNAIHHIETFGAIVQKILVVVDRGGLSNIPPKYKTISLLTHHNLLLP